jgi:hypothetical protein
MQQQPATRPTIGTTALDMSVEARDTMKKQQGLGDLTQLITKESSDLGVISLWGAGGDLGKTSIIRKAYQDPEIVGLGAPTSHSKYRFSPFSP